MRHANMDSGFFVCWILNMFLNWEIGAVALALWAISLWFNVSWYPAAAVGAIWVVGTFIVTALFGWIIGTGSTRHSNTTGLANVNPYSSDNSNLPSCKRPSCDIEDDKA